MAEHIDPADRLRAIGRRDTLALDGDRLAAIEARVMATITAPVALESSDAPADGHTRRARWFAVAAALLVLAVLGAVALAVRDRSDGVLIQAADGVVIEQPDGAPEAGAAGAELFDGTVVEIGPGGSATVDGVEYGPGRYIVDGGILRPAPPEITPTGDDGGVLPAVATTTTSTSTTTSTTTSSTTVAPTTTSTSVAVRPTEPPAVTRSPAADPTTTVRPQRTTTTTTTTTTVAVPPTRPPTTQPPIWRPQATQPPASRPTTTTTPPPSTRPPRP